MAKPHRATRWSTLFILIVVAIVICCSHAHSSVPAQTQEAHLLEVTGTTKAIPDFVPTEEWQDILPGQAIPPGLHVRLNLATGKREAKLMSDDEIDAGTNEDPNIVKRDVEVHLEKVSDASVTVTTDITGEVRDASFKSHALAVVDEPEAVQDKASTTSEIEPQQEDEAPPAREPNWNHEKIYEVLQSLPQPPDVDGMDIHEAHAKLSTPEFRRHMITLWKKRQEELKEAIDTMQDDAKYLAKLLDQFKEAEKNGDTDGQTRVLEVLEWEVQDLDKTHVFNFIGGFNVIAEYLNSTNLPVRAHASWLIGTAVKNYKDGQDWAINAGAIPKLVGSLALSVPSSDTELATKIFEVKKKALYGLSSLVRFNPRGQRLLLSLEGPEKLSALMTDDHPLGVQLKTILFVHDLLLEQPGQVVSQDSAALEYLHGAFRSPTWCAHTAKFIAESYPKIQRNQIVETLQAMDAQLPACQEAFTAANARLTVQEIQAQWQSDSTLDDDEREDLVETSSSLLSKL